MGSAPNKTSSVDVETSNQGKTGKRKSTLEAKKKKPRPTLADDDISDPDDEGEAASSFVSSFFSESSFFAENVLPRLYSSSARVSSFLTEGRLRRRPPPPPSPSPSPSDEATAANGCGDNPGNRQQKSEKQPKSLGRSSGGVDRGGGREVGSQEATAGTAIEGAGDRWRRGCTRNIGKEEVGVVKEDGQDGEVDFV
jgi:hypothetical protein